MGTAKSRIAWVDILRFLGMTMIYWGHLGLSDNVLLYIFAHHVPLFFFISGFFAQRAAEENMGRFLWKKVRSLVFPYLFFTILYYGFHIIVYDLPIKSVPSALWVSLRGIRNEVAGPLWFFTCLFVVVILYELLRRISAAIFGNGPAGNMVCFFLCVGLYIVGICFLGHEPTQDPRWIWNVDSALVYILYYALGALTFPLLSRWEFREQKSLGKVFFFFFFAVAVGFAVFTCLRGAAFTESVRTRLASLLPSRLGQDALFEVYALLSALLLIFLEICIARMLALIPLISRFLAFVGKDSLYHCGNELIVKYFGALGISALGLLSFMQNDWALLLYSILCLVVLKFTLNLLERMAFGRLFQNGQIRFRK